VIKIDFDTVSDGQVPDSAHTSELFRRLGVRFRRLKYFEELMLRNSINAVRICEKYIMVFVARLARGMLYFRHILSVCLGKYGYNAQFVQ